MKVTFSLKMRGKVVKSELDTFNGLLPIAHCVTCLLDCTANDNLSGLSHSLNILFEPHFVIVDQMLLNVYYHNQFQDLCRYIHHIVDNALITVN